MKNFLKNGLLLLVIISFMIGGTLQAKELKASLAKMPGYAESVDKGVLVDLVKAMEKAYGKKIIRQVVPFARSMNNIIEGEVDFHMPLIKLPDSKSKKLPYDYSAETIFHVNFVLYSHKDKPLDMKQMKTYKLETDRAHINYFEFPIAASSGIDSSLKKLAAKRIDGFIFADFATDPVLKQMNSKEIKRQLFKVYDVKIILKKGDAGGTLDRKLSEIIGKLRESGEYDKIMSSIEKAYDNWQM